MISYRIFGLVALLVAVASMADEPQLLTCQIAVHNGFMGMATMDDTGHMFYVVQDELTNTQDVYVDGVNISAALLGAERHAFATGFAGGSYAWWGRGTNTGGKNHAFVNDVDISALYLPTVGDARTAGISPGGLAWFGKTDEPGSRMNVYRDGTLLSGMLGSVRDCLAVGINDAGDVLWQGWGQVNNFNLDVWVNQTNYTGSLLDPVRDCRAVDISNDGLVAWYGKGAGIPEFHAFKGTVDYSEPLLGPDVEARSVFVNERGQFAWVEYLQDIFVGITDVWLDDVNVTENLLGMEREAWPVWLNEAGDLLWWGRGTNLDAIQDVFLNQTNLSERVLGPGRGTSHAVALNDNGWVVWQTPTDEHTRIVRVTMPCRESAAGEVRLELFWGDLEQVEFTVSVRASHTGWEMGSVPLNVDGEGNFTLALPAGEFDLTFRADKHLARTVSRLDTTICAADGINAVLLAGDVDGDNDVDMRDLSFVLYGWTGSEYDVNGDGTVDLYDLNIVLKNMGEVGDE
jgi:hypothetical protein